MDYTVLETSLNEFTTTLVTWSSSPEFYAQCGLIIISVLVAYLLSRILINNSPLLQAASIAKDNTPLHNGLGHISALLFPVLAIVALAFCSDISDTLIEQSGLIRGFQGLAVLFMLYRIITQFVDNRLLRMMIKWTIIPIAMLHVFGWLDEVTLYLDDIDFTIGSIEFSAYGIFRVVIFGSLLFWLGRVSNNAGQQIIRKQEDIDLSTRELFAKLFEVVLYMVVFILLLQVMGINLTTLAVFGGALGVGLGFGLQAIASNFISGIILLMDRSLSVGDHIELEDGRCGIIHSMNMRSSALETYDGKVIMVPNETFITTTFTNWTHNNKKQRYSIEFQVAYKTDLHKLFEILREVVAKHPQVISGDSVPIEERPDAEIAGFGDSGVDILIEFWMEGIDDGKNRVGADLLLMIWDALKENDMEIPFPQREVRVLGMPDTESLKQ